MASSTQREAGPESGPWSSSQSLLCLRSTWPCIDSCKPAPHSWAPSYASKTTKVIFVLVVNFNTHSVNFVMFCACSCQPLMVFDCPMMCLIRLWKAHSRLLWKAGCSSATLRQHAGSHRAESHCFSSLAWECCLAARSGQSDSKMVFGKQCSHHGWNRPRT